MMQTSELQLPPKRLLCARPQVQSRFMLAVTVFLVFAAAMMVFAVAAPGIAQAVPVEVASVTTTYVDAGGGDAAAGAPVLDNTLVIAFSEAMDVGQNLGYANITVTGDSAVFLLMTHANWSTDATTLNIPINGLVFGATYRVSIDGLYSALGFPVWPAIDIFFQTPADESALSPEGGLDLLNSNDIEIVEVSAGQNFTLALDSFGNIWAWGANANGQLGLGNTTARNIPVQMPMPTDVDYWVSISAGAMHSLALDNDGNLWGWGHGGNGRLATGSTAAINGAPSRVLDVAGGPTLGGPILWDSVYAGGSHTMAIDTDGSLWAWGNNQQGRLGIGSAALSSNVPVRVPDVAGGPTLGGPILWDSVYAGGNHTAAIGSDGNLWAWGMNNGGQLGLGDAVNRDVPYQVTNPVTVDAWVSVALGNAHTLALDNDGNLWAWGLGGGGRLGLGPASPGNQNVPHPVIVPAAVDYWTSIAAGETYSLALDNDGNLWGWGVNNDGQLGTGSTGAANNIPLAADVDGIEWTAITAGTGHSIAIDVDGHPWAWGNNATGQLAKGIVGGGQGNGDSVLDGTNNWLPWRIAASVMPEDASDWTAADDATAPENDEIDVAVSTDSITVYFDRPMNPDVDGDITIDEGAEVDLDEIEWSDSDRGENTVLSVPLDLLDYDTTYTVTVEEFIDAQFGKEGTNEMYPHTWTFTTEDEDERDQITYDYTSCGTCHFTNNIAREHAVRSNGCQTCHSETLSDREITNWSHVDVDPMGDLVDDGCLACHEVADEMLHGGAMRVSGAHMPTPSIDAGCSASGCHNSTDEAGGFAFGDMDFASAHNDFWQAARDDRVSSSANVVPSMQGDANPFGCGVCHDRTHEDTVRPQIRSMVRDARDADSLTCLTCHNDGANPTGAYSTVEFVTHNELRIPVSLLIDVSTGSLTDTVRLDLGVTDLLDSLSPESRVEFSDELQPGGRLQPGVLQPDPADENGAANENAELTQQLAAELWLEQRRGGLGNLLAP